MHKEPLLVAVGLALVAALGACSWGGNAQVAKQTNLANQREAALVFLKRQGGVDGLRFTQEGGRPGFGASWRANAVVTIRGEDYHAILDLRSFASEPLPDIAPSAVPTSVPVTYSDGAAEVIWLDTPVEEPTGSGSEG